MAVSYSLSKAGLEVYTTEPVKEDTKKSTETTEVSNNFALQTGATKQIDYIGELYSDSFEFDYTDISSNASVSVPIKYLNNFFKGKKVALKKGLQEQGSKLKWNDMDTVILGFITEITWNKNNVDLKINGMDKLLEKEGKFTFTKTKRSKVITEIIKASGLKAKVDVVGLKDDVIDFTNVSSGSSSSKANGSSTGSSTIDGVVEDAIQGLTDALEIAKAVDKAFKEHVFYKYYKNVRHPDLDEAWQNAHLNCADGANILCAMFLKAGFKATIVHTPNHYIVKITIDKKTYYTDNAAATGSHTTRAFGEVWRNITSGSSVGTKIKE